MKKFEDPIENALNEAKKGFLAGWRDRAASDPSQRLALLILLALVLTPFAFFMLTR